MAPRASIPSTYLSSYDPPEIIITVEAGGNDLRAFQTEYVFTGKCSQPDPTDCLTGLYITLATMEYTLHFAVFANALRE